MLTASHSEPQTQSLPSLSLEFPKEKTRIALGPQPECSGVFDYTEGQSSATGPGGGLVPEQSSALGNTRAENLSRPTCSRSPRTQGYYERDKLTYLQMEGK